MKRIVSTVWLTIVWVTLWEAVTWANLLGGIVVATGVAYVIPPRGPSAPVSFRPLPALRLLVHFSWELIKASALLAWEVVTPRMRVNAAVISVELTTSLAGTITAVANLVSLTPGTLTLEVDERQRKLFIHILHLRTLESARRSVLTLERLVVAAFPPRMGDVDGSRSGERP